MHHYVGTIEFTSEEPMDEEIIDSVTCGLHVAVDDPSNAEGDGLHWSGRPTSVRIKSLEEERLAAVHLGDDIASIIRKRGCRTPDSVVMATADILDLFARYMASTP